MQQRSICLSFLFFFLGASTSRAAALDLAKEEASLVAEEERLIVRYDVLRTSRSQNYRIEILLGALATNNGEAPLPEELPAIAANYGDFQAQYDDFQIRKTRFFIHLFAEDFERVAAAVAGDAELEALAEEIRGQKRLFDALYDEREWKSNVERRTAATRFFAKYGELLEAVGEEALPPEIRKHEARKKKIVAWLKNTRLGSTMVRYLATKTREAEDRVKAAAADPAADLIGATRDILNTMNYWQHGLLSTYVYGAHHIPVSTNGKALLNLIIVPHQGNLLPASSTSTAMNGSSSD